ncbi:LexA family transcriptional regulator [Psychrobacillus psychrodurans]|uniref:LexA family protein n=1 Tax=Psychrobacillus psychrodurans TaxID=126157 RepID=UPI001F4E4D4F|nr:LexA family transcriptional regulator [Psychrobacillus psychrodurans]
MRNSMEMGSYIESVLNRIGMKPIELANRIGVDRSTVTRYLKGTRKISMEDVPKIANAIGINPMELLMDENDKKPTNVIDISQRTVKIPVLGEIACGDPILAEENYEDYRDELAESLPAGELVYLKAKGDSMSPTIPSGSFVLVRAQSDVENGEIAAVLVNGNTEATLKRVKKQGDVIILMPDNSAHQPYIVDKNNPAKIIGKAIRFTQDL